MLFYLLQFSHTDSLPLFLSSSLSHCFFPSLSLSLSLSLSWVCRGMSLSHTNTLNVNLDTARQEGDGSAVGFRCCGERCDILGFIDLLGAWPADRLLYRLPVQIKSWLVSTPPLYILLRGRAKSLRTMKEPYFNHFFVLLKLSNGRQPEEGRA